MSDTGVFKAAVKLAPDKRAAYLDEACGANLELRHEVESLLKAHDEAGSFLHGGMVRPSATADFLPITEKPGTMIGPYKLKEQIGEGGFGLVFVAEQQEPVKRKVALKVIKPGMDTREVMARFTAERQALALMDHPNIARVLDAGATDSGRPYFVMELVRGIPITDYCDKNQLSPRDRLDLFITVCQAVQHAHQKGIIHRDIKPSNVLVTSHDGKPVAKVIDFGVAKAIHQQLTDRSIYTNFAQMVGTPLYMSPEQAEMSGLDIDTRSDIYSLGVLLYELLTGTTPLDKKRIAKAAYDEIRRMIREDEPQKPSTRLSTSEAITSVAAQRHTEPAKLSKLMRGDLDWITMKSLEKDRTRRYETANGLARDIQRYLSDEAVEACPPSAGYRLRKAVRRHKGPVFAAAVIVLSLIVGIVGTGWGLVRAERARNDAEQARAAESEQRQRAEADEQKALAAAAAEKQAKETAQAREAETNAVVEFVQSKIFAAARPEGQAGGLGHDVTLRRAVESAVPFIHDNFAQQPLIEARLRTTLGTSFLYLGDAKKAAEELRAAFALYSQHLGPDHPKTLSSISRLANSYDALGRKVEALKLREETLTLRKANLGPDHPDTLASMHNLANSYEDLGRQAEALKLREETLALRKAKLRPDHPDIPNSMTNLAQSYAAIGRQAEALKLREEALALQKAMLGPDHPDTLSSMSNLAGSYFDAGRHFDAVRLREGTLAIRKVKLGPDHPDTLMSMYNLANSYAALGRQPEALVLREETLKQCKAKLGPDHALTLASMNELANSYAGIGRQVDALKLREEAHALYNANLGRDDSETLWGKTRLADGYAALDRYTEAIKLYEEVLASSGKIANPNDEVRFAATKGAAQSHQSLGHRKESAAYWAKVQALAPKDTLILLSAAAASLDAGDAEGYTAVCRRAMTQFAGTDDPVAAERVAKACLLAPPPPEELAQLVALVDTAVTRRGKDNKGFNYCLLVRGIAAYRSGDWAATLDWCGRSRKGGSDIPDLVALNSLFEAMAHHKLGHSQPAGEALAEAARILDQHRDALPGSGKPAWHDWVICDIFRKEAESLIKK